MRPKNCMCRFTIYIKSLHSPFKMAGFHDLKKNPKKHSTSPKEYHHHSEAMCWQQHALGLLFLSWAVIRVDGINNSSKYQSILAQNLRASAKTHKIKRNFIFQHDNLKHTFKSTKQCLQQNMIKVLEWLSQCPALNPNKNIWGGLKRVVHRKRPENFTKIKCFCKEE